MVLYLASAAPQAADYVIDSCVQNWASSNLKSSFTIVSSKHVLINCISRPWNVYFIMGILLSIFRRILPRFAIPDVKLSTVTQGTIDLKVTVMIVLIFSDLFFATRLVSLNAYVFEGCSSPYVSLLATNKPKIVFIEKLAFVKSDELISMQS